MPPAILIRIGGGRDVIVLKNQIVITKLRETNDTYLVLTVDARIIPDDMLAAAVVVVGFLTNIVVVVAPAAAAPPARFGMTMRIFGIESAEVDETTAVTGRLGDVIGR